MASISSKIALILGSNLHKLLDDTINLNSVEACRHQVRKLEEQANSVARRAGEARADVSIAQSRIETTQLTIDENTANAELLLGDDDPSNDNVGLTLMEEVVSLKETLVDQQQSLAEAKEVAEVLTDASAKLGRMRTDLVRNIHKLEGQERTAKSKTGAADALDAVAALTNGSGAVSVDDVAARVKRNAAVADERFKEALTGASGGTAAEAVRTAKAKALIAEMKAKKAGKPVTG